MVGYLNNKNKIKNQWYQIFIQKLRALSLKDDKYWQHIQNLDLSHFNENDWKYIPLQELLQYNFTYADKITLNTEDLLKYKQLILPIESYRLVFINGCLSKPLSDTLISPWIIKIDKNIDSCLTLNSIQPNIFTYLTACLNNTMAHIILPKGKITKKPLYLLYINTGSNIKNILINSHYHHLIKIEQNTDTSIIEHVINCDKYKHFSGVRTSIQIEDHAKLHHIKLIFKNRSSYHIAHQDINIGFRSYIESNTFIILGPKFTYHQTHAKLNYSESSLSLNSLTMLENTDISHVRTYLEHNNHDYASSKQLHKIIACDSSVGIFNGLIKVNPNSIKTDGKMTNNNLLLHENAAIYTKPTLEIYSDNVQCSHGATIGQINTDHLFYLITRGIPKKDAVKILVYAFTTEIMEKIKNTLLKNVILTKIEQTLTRSLYDNISYKNN